MSTPWPASPLALVARGHRVKLVTNPYFDDIVAAAGPEFLPLGYGDEYAPLSRHPDLWHPLRGPKFVLSHVPGDSCDLCTISRCELFARRDCVLWPCTGYGEPRGAANAASAAGERGPRAWSAVVGSRFSAAQGRYPSGPTRPRWFLKQPILDRRSFFVLPLLGPPLNELRVNLGLAPVEQSLPLAV